MSLAGGDESFQPRSTARGAPRLLLERDFESSRAAEEPKPGARPLGIVSHHQHLPLSLWGQTPTPKRSTCTGLPSQQSRLLPWLGHTGSTETRGLAGFCQPSALGPSPVYV